jgi:hypothetical protein
MRETIETCEPFATQDALCETLVRIDRPIRAVVAKLVVPAELMAELAQAIVADERSEHGGPVARLPVNAVAH